MSIPRDYRPLTFTDSWGLLNAYLSLNLNPPSPYQKGSKIKRKIKIMIKIMIKGEWGGLR